MNILTIVPALVMALFLTLGIDLNIIIDIKADTIILVLGNLAIAVYIASILNKGHRNYELKVENCFKELMSLEEYLKTLREMSNKLLKDDYTLNRHSSLINLQISLISKYSFINKTDINKLKEYYLQLNIELTGKDTVDQNYRNTILQFEKRILVIKSSIL